MTQMIVHKCIQITCMRGYIVEAVRADLTLTKPAEIGHDHLESRVDQRLNHLPVNTHRLGPTVHTHERNTADAVANENLPEPTRVGVVQRKAVRVKIRRRHIETVRHEYAMSTPGFHQRCTHQRYRTFS